MPILSATTLASDYLSGVAAGDNTSLAILGRGLTRAEALVAKKLGYPGATPTLASSSYTLRLAGARLDPKRLLLPVAPVTAIASIYQDETLAFGSSALIDSGDYEQEDLPNGAYLHLLPNGTTASWLTQSRSIKVSLTAGYANEAAIPTPLADAIYRLVADWWLRRTNRHLGSLSQGGQNQSILALEDASPDVLAILGEYTLLGTMGAT